MIDIINKLIDIAILRGVKPTVLRLDKQTEAEFIKELNDAAFTSTPSTHYCPLTYCYMQYTLDVVIDRESRYQPKKVYIEIE